MKSASSGTASSLAVKALAIACLCLWWAAQPLVACGIYYHGEEYRVSLLSPWLAGEEYAPFFYSAYQFYPVNAPSSGHDRRRNCTEWAAYMGEQVDPAHVQAVLYGSSLDELQNALSEDGCEGAALATNGFWKALRQPKYEAVRDYVLFAKQYERYATHAMAVDPWESYSYDYIDFNEPMNELQQLAKQRLSSAQDPFLRQRYAYQNLVMARYQGDKARFKSLWDQYFAAEAERGSVLYDWALHHKAAMVSNEAERSYLYALSFMRCPEKRLYSFDQFQVKQANRAMGLAKTPEEKAHILAMVALKNPGRALEDIRRVYSTYPKHPLLRLLIIREINKVEDWLLTTPVTGFGPAFHPVRELQEVYSPDDEWRQFRDLNQRKDEAYLAEIQSFVQQTQSTGSLPADIRQLLLGHLSMLRKDTPAAQAAWQNIPARSSKAILTQLNKDRLLLLLNEKDLSQPRIQQQMQSLLQSWKASLEGREEDMRDWLVVCKMISQQYEQQNRLVEAFLLNNHALELPSLESYSYNTAFYTLFSYLDWRADEQTIDQILALIDKPRKTAWESFLLQAPLPPREALLDLRGTISFRQGKLDEALLAFEQIDPSFWRERYEYSTYLNNDPFVARALTRPPFKPFPESKAALLRQLISLEKQLAAPAAQAAAIKLQLGIAWLNFSRYGNSWMMFVYGQGAIDNDPDFRPKYLPSDEKLRDIYLRMTKAEGFFEQVLAADADVELKSKASYLLAHIQELRRLSADDNPPWEEEARKAYLLQILQVYEPWQKSYQKTQTFQTVMLSCPELAQYFGLASGKKE